MGRAGQEPVPGGRHSSHKYLKLYQLLSHFNCLFVLTIFSGSSSCQASSPRRGLESPLCGDSAKPSGGGLWKPLFAPSRPSLHCQRGASNVHKATFLAAKNQCSIEKGKIRPHPQEPGTRGGGQGCRTARVFPGRASLARETGLVRFLAFAEAHLFRSPRGIWPLLWARACVPRTYLRLRSDLDSAPGPGFSVTG